jgi:2,4-dienoyl-CoA reductase-like NADH-dependent reductase (Old Yellow Enzyme family)
MSTEVLTTELFSPLTLRSGANLRNRVAKAAMEEGMAGESQLPDDRLISLYRRWGAGGAGLLITGNVMVHAEALTGPGGVVLDDRAPLEPFVRWAQAGRCALTCPGWCGRRRRSRSNSGSTASASGSPWQ